MEDIKDIEKENIILKRRIDFLENMLVDYLYSRNTDKYCTGNTYGCFYCDLKKEYKKYEKYSEDKYFEEEFDRLHIYDF